MSRLHPHPLSAALLCLALSPAIAAPPYIERYEFVQPEGPMANCGDFLIIVEGAGTVQLRTYFGDDGVPVRFAMHGVYSGTMTNSVTGAVIDDAPSVANLGYDVQDGVQTNIGAFWTVTVPGSGAMLIEAGRLVFDGSGPPSFIAGPHLPPDETIAALCTALRQASP